MIGYCYLLRHKSGLLYYGARLSTVEPELDLFVTYFTSSNVVKALIHQDGVESFSYQIRERFYTQPMKCFNWEHRFLRKVMAGKNKKFLNGTSGSGFRKINGDSSVCGWKWINNQITEITWPTDRIEIPNGWELGRIRCPTTGLVWVNNGIKNSRVKPNNIQPGWTAGRINLPKSFTGDSKERPHIFKNKASKVHYEKISKLQNDELETYMNQKGYSEIRKRCVRTTIRKMNERQ
jgi:hypothetical protein